MMLNSFKEYDYCFWTMMGKYFSRKEIIKEMDSQLYSNPNMKWYILYENINDIKGFISIEKKNKFYYIDNFYVLDRKKGYGNKIFSKIMDDYKNKTIKLKIIIKMEDIIK